MIFYPPLYPYFIAAVHELTGSLTAVKLAQAVLGALLAAAIACVGAHVFGARVGLLGGLLAALAPDVVWFAAHFWSETLFLALIWAAIERVLAADRDASSARRAEPSSLLSTVPSADASSARRAEPSSLSSTVRSADASSARRAEPSSPVSTVRFADASMGKAIAGGVLWGLAVLTRETALYFVVVAAGWLAWKRGAAGGRRAAAFLVGALLMVAPWTYRNWVVFDAFIPVSTAGGQNLFQGNTRIARDTTYEMVDDVRGRVEQYRYAMRMGLRAIWERQPTWIFEKLYEQMPNFWEADNLAIIHVKRGADTPPGGYGPTRVSTAWLVAALTVFPYLAVLVGFVIGLRDLPLTRYTLFLVAFLLYYNAIHVVTHGFARYRLPVMPVVFLIAAWGFVAPRASRPAPTPARRVVAALVAVVLLLCLVPGVRQTVAHPAFGGSGAAAAGEP
jgi:hypothetical protein